VFQNVGKASSQIGALAEAIGRLLLALPAPAPPPAGP
jgi:hypothetical protein